MKELQEALSKPFIAGFITCALWASNDESTPQGGEPFDANYGPEDFSAAALAKIISECEEFQERAKPLPDYGITGSGEHYPAGCSAAERAGHDFFLTRNHHGVGFWDRSELSQADRDRLTEFSHAFGEMDLYLSDAGKIEVETSRPNNITSVMQADKERRDAETLATVQRMREEGAQALAAQYDPKTRRRIDLYIAAKLEGQHDRARRAQIAAERTAPDFIAKAFFTNPGTGEEAPGVTKFRAMLNSTRADRQQAKRETMKNQERCNAVNQLNAASHYAPQHAEKLRAYAIKLQTDKTEETPNVCLSSDAILIYTDAQLRILTTAEGAKVLAGLIENNEQAAKSKYGHPKNGETILWELLEDLWTNGQLDSVQPEEIAALTDAPIYCDWKETDDHGTLENIGRVYWFERYQIEDPAEELAKYGEVVFPGAPENTKKTEARE